MRNRCIEATTLRLLLDAIERRRDKTELPNDYRLQYFVLLTRLRQAVDHPLLLYTWMKNIIPSEDIRMLLKDLANIEPKTSVYDQIVASSENLVSTKPKIKLEESNPSPGEFGTNKLDVFFNFDEHLNHVLDSKDNDGCTMCFQKSDVRELEVCTQTGALTVWEVTNCVSSANIYYAMYVLQNSSNKADNRGQAP